MAFAMGAWCRDLQPAGVINGIPGNHFELADQTGTSAVQTLASKAKFFRAVVYIKNSTATGSVAFTLKAASLVTLGTSAQNIDSRQFGGSAGSYTFILEGFAPDAGQGGLGFVRLEVGGTGWTYDAILDGL